MDQSLALYDGNDGRLFRLRRSRLRRRRALESSICRPGMLPPLQAQRQSPCSALDHPQTKGIRAMIWSVCAPRPRIFAAISMAPPRTRKEHRWRQSPLLRWRLAWSGAFDITWPRRSNCSHVGREHVAFVIVFARGARCRHLLSNKSCWTFSFLFFC